MSASTAFSQAAVLASPGAEGWVRVGVVDDIPPMEGRRTTIDGRKIALFRLPDGIAAIDAECPHKGGPLQDGLVADSCVTCPLHDRRFDLRTGAMRGGEDVVAVHEVRTDGEELWIKLAEPVSTLTRVPQPGASKP